MIDFWNKRYNEDGFAYGTNPNAFFKEQIDKLKVGNLLLPLEGEGRNAVYAASKGWKVDAVDQSEIGHDKTRKFAKENNVPLKYFLQNIEDFKAPSEYYDAIGLIYAHLPPITREDLHKSIVKTLKLKGIVMLEAFSKKQVNYPSGGPKTEEMLFSVDELKRDFSRLKILSINEKLITLDEGKYHQGKAMVVRLVAQKR
tara:strand:+ start:3005 stop:3601 length:597 start_codon:yes stop_codon:yes gene_type:complete